jgi:predicted deacylase
VELRGQADVDHDIAAADAHNLFMFLQRRGLIDGQAPSLPPLTHEPTPLTGMGRIVAETPGVVVFYKQPGDQVSKGELVAEVVNPLVHAPADPRCPYTSPTDGRLFARISDRYARPGRILAKVAGAVPLRGEGENLLTM